MLKPSAYKTAASAETATLVAAFLARGGIVQPKPDAVALGLKKTRYMKANTKVA